MEHHSIPVNATLQALAARSADVWTLDACGVTRSQTPIPALVHRDAYAPTTPRAHPCLARRRALRRQEDVNLAYNTLEAYVEAGDHLGRTLVLSAVPCGNPDGLALGVGPENGAGGRPEHGYPPLEQFFYDPHNPERRYPGAGLACKRRICSSKCALARPSHGKRQPLPCCWPQRCKPP